MHNLIKKINAFLYNDFIFSNRFRIWRHLIYWSFHITIWSAFWVIMGAPSYERMLFNMVLWIPVFILFSYPLVYLAIPHLLLKGRVWQFILLILAWGAVGLFFNYGFRTYIYVPLQEAMGLSNLPLKGQQPHSYLCMATSAASPMIIKFFKLWTIKERQWMKIQEERITAELQLLKAQVHPQFLFNTLNSIYSFSVQQSPKTPGLILKLSSLLSYMLYDCKSEEVRLAKEVEMMKNYIDLENERHDNKIDVSWSVEGDIKGKFITPLLLLSFLENAFKHSTSKQVDKPWLGVDISVQQDIFRCKIANSKSEYSQFRQEGNGISNVRKRLDHFYPGKYELKINDEGTFFVVSLQIKSVTEPEVFNVNLNSPVIIQTTPA